MAKPANILVVDDDPALLRLISLVLRSEDMEVSVANGGESALGVLDQSEPDLILLDLNMPGMDGKTFYQEARTRGYSGPVVICSAYGASAAQRELGAEGALSKPFEPDTMVSLVRELVFTRS